MTIRSFRFVAAGLVGLLAACAHHHSPLAPTNVRVTGVTPLTGSSFGGTEITIRGEGFGPGLLVTVGGLPATNVVVVDQETITATTPAHAVGSAGVTIVKDERVVGLAGAFSFGSPGTSDNTPPVIQSITSSGLHAGQPNGYAEVSEPLTLAVVAIDAETPPDALDYTWTAPGGSFSGAGAVSIWQPPADAVIPTTMTLTLTVTEHFKEPDAKGLPVDRTNVVTATFDVGVHDAKQEVSAMGKKFLDLFSDSNLGPDQVLQDFYQPCLDQAFGESELPDVINNRRDFTIISSNIQPALLFTLNFSGLCDGLNDIQRNRLGDACAYYQAHWDSRAHVDGSIDHATGVDQVSALYRDKRWYLCQSEFRDPNNLQSAMFRKR
jgi:hypothetical protein